MRFRCPFCSYIIKPDDAYRGYKVQCPSCEKTVLVPVSPFEPGCLIGDFIIEGKIGKGSIGSVYRAVQVSLDRTVALKVLSPEYTNAKGISDFLKEARAAAKLSHTNIVQAFAVGEEDGTCYMAMNYIRGESLKDKLKLEGKIPVDEALHIAQQVAEALYYAWDEAQLIHRDVKPDNIMINEEGIVKLTDLGLAMQQADWREDMEISGSPSYMSPEQFSGEKLDSRSDIYSLGVTLYQMLSDKLPFDGDTLRTVATQHFEENAIPLNKLDLKISPKVASLVKKMMAKLPEERYGSMEELLNKIWTIRQETAPNRDLVPDVHTISINRLDYDFQNVSQREQEHQKLQAKALPKASSGSGMYKALAIVFAFLSLALVVALISVSRKTTVNTFLKKRVEAFGFQVESGNTAFDDLNATGARLLLEMKTPSSQEEEALCSLTKMYLAQNQASKMQSQLDDMGADSAAQEKKMASLKKQVNKLSSSKYNEASRSRQKLDNIESSLGSLQAQNRKLASKLKELAEKKLEIEKAWENDWKNNVNAKLYTLLGKGYPKQAIFFLKTEAQARGEKHNDWFVDKAKWLRKLAAIHAALTASGSKYSGVTIKDDQEEGKIIMIEEGKIHYKTLSDNIIKTAQWDDLPLQSSYLIAKAAFSEGKEINSYEEDFETVEDLERKKDLKAEVALLRGSVGLALQQKPKHHHTKEICQAILKQTLDKIRYVAEYDKPKARAKLKSLLKNLKETDVYEKVRNDFKDLLDDETDSWEDEFKK